MCPILAVQWTVAHQAPLSMGFSRQEYGSGLPFPSPGDLLDPGIEPGSPALQADALPSEPPGNPVFLIYWSYISFLFLSLSSSFPGILEIGSVPKPVQAK